VVDGLRAALADELNTPAALSVVDHWAAETLGGDTSEPTGAGVVARAIDALLGIRL
jgi:L-cysteine:1D-myo-inositol 2-amino-2-deoxy-alpha-D-glucopyranoside ligase